MESTLKLIRIARLIARKREDILTQKEEKELREWLDDNPSHAELLDQLMKDESIYKDLEDLEKIPYRRAFEKTWKQIQADAGSKKISLNTKIWRYAASIIILLGTTLGVFFGWLHQQNKYSIADISQPGSNKAILITGNQEEIILGDTTKTYKLVAESGVNIYDSATVLTYNTIDSTTISEEPIKMNTLITPRGGEYTLLLADGTEIMLNSESKLVFPEKFTGNSREVFLQGEAYFRVAKSEKRFIVNSEKIDVVVYGTEFNLSVYNDEAEQHATLIEGSVGVQVQNKKPDSAYELYPGEQLKLENESGNLSITSVDTDLVTAWTRDMFRFDNEELGYILMKLSKWYSFKYRFEEASLQQRSFTCDLMKYDDITPILDMISSASDIEFAVNRKTLIVKEKVKN